MFFFASKIFWMFASPINLLLFAALVGVLLCFGRRARFGRGLAMTAILILIVAATLPLGMLLIAPLENRFPVPPPDLRRPGGDYRAWGGDQRPSEREPGRRPYSTRAANG